MKTIVIFFSILSTLFLSNKSFSQGEAAVWFLTFPVSPSQNAMGYTGTSLPIDDPYGFLLNPAQLGYTSQQNNFSYMLYPSKVNLWDADEFRIKGSAFNIGYNFKDLVGIPISVGFGFANPELKLSLRNPNNEWDLEDKDKYEAYSVGVGIDYLVQFSAGITYKSIHSKIIDFSASSFPPPYFEINPNTIDYGFLLNVPVLNLINNEISFSIINDKPMKPFFNFSLGYSQSNIGDEIYYVAVAQKDPLPRTARLGYGISTGIDIKIAETSLKFLKFDFTVDAEDLLLKYETISLDDRMFPSIKRFSGYQSFIGDINVGKNIFQIKGDNNVISRSGFQINAFEFFTYKRGHLNGHGYNDFTTNGVEFRISGLLKFAKIISNDPVINFISNHFDMRYYNSNYKATEGLETNMKGIAFYVRNLDSIF